jgi:UrcA family protein
MSEKLTSLLAACAVTLIGLAIAAPAVAGPVVVTATSQDIPVRYVTYRDLNLTNPAGASKLVSRVKHAVNDVCFESVGEDYTRRFAQRDCREVTWQGAQPQIDRAIQRATDIAANGWSAIAPVAISISVR